MKKLGFMKIIGLLWITTCLFFHVVEAQQQAALKVNNETFAILKKVSDSPLSNGRILLSLTTHQDLGWIDEISKCVVMRDTQWITPFMDRLSREDSFEMDIEQTSIIKEYLVRHPYKKQEITKRLHEGRMLIGATYTQPYEEMYFSESLARQFYLGKLWLKKEFDGYNATSYYNADVPGRTMQMPQLLAKSGVDNMFISRHERGVFDWFSPDGSKVTTYSPGHYIDFYNILGKSNEDALRELANQALIWTDGYNDIQGEKAVMPAVLNFEFIWDPKPVENLDPFMIFWNNLEFVENENGEKLQVKLPKIHFSTLDKFFQQLRKSTRKFPAIMGERPNVWIYIHGPSHHWAIDYSRKADILLPAAEKFAAFDALLSGSFSKYPSKMLESAWESKIYPDHGWGGKGGQSTDDIFLMRFKDAHDKAEMIIGNSLQSLASKINTISEKGIPVVVFNSLNWERTEPVSFQMNFDEKAARSIRLYGKDGKEVEVQLGDTERDNTGFLKTADITFVATNVPSMGFDTYYLQLSEEPQNQIKQAFNPVFENRFYKAEFSDGGLSGLFDKEINQQLIEDTFFKAGEIFTMRSEGNGAGEFDAVQQPTMEGFDKTGNYKTAWEVAANGPVFTAFKYRQPIRNAVVEFEIRFYHQIKKVDFDVALMNWDGTMFREFRMALPLNIENGQVAYEAPFGVVEVGKDEISGAAGERYNVPADETRPRGIENWIGASGDEFGVTMASSVVAADYMDPTDNNLKNCILQPILLASRRSCHGEGNDYHQTGDHKFSFSFTSHKPGWEKGARFGKASNEKLFVVVNPDKFKSAVLNESMSFIKVDNESIIVSALKKAENDNGIAVRLYNTSDRKTEVNINIPGQFKKVWLTNLIEEKQTELSISSGALKLEVGIQSIETLLITED